jgi:hypothetical protein
VDAAERCRCLFVCNQEAAVPRTHFRLCTPALLCPDLMTSTYVLHFHFFMNMHICVGIMLVDIVCRIHYFCQSVYIRCVKWLRGAQAATEPALQNYPQPELCSTNLELEVPRIRLSPSNFVIFLRNDSKGIKAHNMDQRVCMIISCQLSRKGLKMRRPDSNFQRSRGNDRPIRRIRMSVINISRAM